MATILSETKSSGGSPYAYYTVNASASDRTVDTVKVSGTIDSKLSSSNSSLGAGGTMGLIAYLKFNDKEYSVELKKTTEKWSGTTTHTKSFSFTIKDLESSQSQLSDIKFRVSRTGSAANDYTKGAAMSSKTCSNLSIGIGHQAPSNITYTITEKNPKLISAGIDNNTYVNMLSIKEYNITATTYDDATLTEYNVYNGIIPAFRTENPVTIDYATKELALWEETCKVPIRVQVGDSMGGYVSSSVPLNPDLYDYVPYIIPKFIETLTNVKRNGQTSGKVKVNIKGNFFNGQIGTLNQSSLTLKYKFWKNGTDAIEPTTYNYTIPSSEISISGNEFSISNYEIGSAIETDDNYFNPDYPYKIKFYVEDNFVSLESETKLIPVGEPTWTEYRDRVDFKKATIKNNPIFFSNVGDIIITSTNTDPATTYGGTWELIDKEFSSASGSNNAHTNNTTNTTNATVNWSRAGHTINLEIGITNKVQIKDADLVFVTLKKDVLGVTNLPHTIDFCGYTDAGNCMVMFHIHYSNGNVYSCDIIPDSYVSVGNWVDGFVSFVVPQNLMLDSACNKFYWKRTA